MGDKIKAFPSKLPRTWLVAGTVFMIMLAIIVWGAVYITSNHSASSLANNSPNATHQSNSTPSGQRLVVIKNNKGPIETVGTSLDRFQLELDTITVHGSVMTVNFSLYCPPAAQVCIAPASDFPTNGLSGAYAVDEATGAKYQVLTDPNGQPLVSQNYGTQSFLTESGNEKASFYVQLQSPPQGSTLTINIPDCQALIGISV